MARVHRAVLVGATIVGSWLGMQAVHELGHVLGARLTGGQVTLVVLWPFGFSRTDVGNNLHPLVVVWAGPVVGVLLPLLLWGVSAMIRMPGAFVLRFFSGFCLIVNGLYIGLGSFGRVGDCNEMLRYGSAMWQLWLFGLVTVPFGLLLWHRQGASFGFGAAEGRVSPYVAYATLGVCVALLILGIVVDGR